MTRLSLILRQSSEPLTHVASVIYLHTSLCSVIEIVVYSDTFKSVTIRLGYSVVTVLPGLITRAIVRLYALLFVSVLFATAYT